MADSSNTLFMARVQEIAPTIHSLVSSRNARLIASMTTHDAINGYGRGFTFHLKLELLIEQCPHCFETGASAPRFDCRWHRFEKRFMQIADAEAPTLEKVLAKMESAMVIRERVATG